MKKIVLACILGGGLLVLAVGGIVWANCTFIELAEVYPLSVPNVGSFQNVQSIRLTHFLTGDFTIGAIESESSNTDDAHVQLDSGPLFDIFDPAGGDPVLSVSTTGVHTWKFTSSRTNAGANGNLCVYIWPATGELKRHFGWMTCKP